MAGVTLKQVFNWRGLLAADRLSDCFAGVGAMSIDWVTNPQEDDALMHTSKPGKYCDRLQQLRLNTTVLYGTNSTALLSTGQGTYTCYTADEYQSGALHHVVLGLGPEGPLKASTEYHYQVGDQEFALSELYSFTTPPEASSFPYRLGLIGDLGQTEDSMDTLDHAATLEPISILNVGDLSYADGYQPRYISLQLLRKTSGCQILQPQLLMQVLAQQCPVAGCAPGACSPWPAHQSACNAASHSADLYLSMTPCSMYTCRYSAFVQVTPC